MGRQEHYDVLPQITISVITLKDLEEWALQKFELSVGKEIKGFEFWNYLIQNGNYPRIVSFVGIVSIHTLKDSIISEDGMTRSFFNQDIERLEERDYNKMFRSYRISGVKIVDGGDVQYIRIYANYRISNGTKWSVAEWILLEMTIR